MDGPATDRVEHAAPGPGTRQRAVNALVLLLAAAVCVQAYMLWETSARLAATAKELESVRTLADARNWQVIPQPSDASSAPASAPYAPGGAGGWDPHFDLDRVRAEMGRLMGHMGTRTGLSPQVGVSAKARAGHYFYLDSDGQAYVVRAELPGVDAADLSVGVEGQWLTVCVKQEQRNEGGVGGGQRRVSGQSTQRIALAEPVDGAAMETSFKEGVLTITIPKAGCTSPGTHSGTGRSVRH